MDHILPDEKQKIRGQFNDGLGSKVILDYNKAIHCIRGPDVTFYDSGKYTNVSDAVREALKNITDRQGTDRGVSILYNDNGYNSEPNDIINIVTEASDKIPLYYISDILARASGVVAATEDEMKMWLNDRGNINLITSIQAAAGWEDISVIVIDNSRGGVSRENMCLRTASNLHLIKYRGMKSRMKF